MRHTLKKKRITTLTKSANRIYIQGYFHKKYDLSISKTGLNEINIIQIYCFSDDGHVICFNGMDSRHHG